MEEKLHSAAMARAITGVIAIVFSPVLAQNPSSPSTWSVIQEQIWDIQCVGCHVAGTSFALQSDLVLTSDVAYSELVDALPHNPAAAADGLLRVGAEGTTSLYTSFLWEKINAPEQEHFYADHPGYGSLMPLGGPPLTNGELAFIQEWILGGAPEEGVVADTTLLADTTRYTVPPFAPLEPPEHGLQVHLGPFDVWPNNEREFFYYVPLDTTGDIYIDRFEVTMRPGSHHFIAYSFVDEMPSSLSPPPYTYRDIRDSTGQPIDGNLFHTLFHSFGVGTQWPWIDDRFPSGIAVRLNASKGLDLNSHYVNQSDTTYPGEVYMNLHLVPPDSVEHIAEVLRLSHFSFSLPPQQVTTVTQTFTFDEPVNIFQMFSHAHRHMVEFRVTAVGGEHDGELVYVAYDWSHPPILRLDPPLHLDAREGLRLDVTYNNDTDETISFGFLSEDEMMILFGYYFVGPDIAGTREPREIPQQWALHQNFPNPFNPSTTLRYDLPDAGRVALKIYDIVGREVRTLVDAPREAGHHQVVWDGRDGRGRIVSSGVYIARLQAGSFVQSRKIALVM